MHIDPLYPCAASRFDRYEGISESVRHRVETDSVGVRALPHDKQPADTYIPSSREQDSSMRNACYCGHCSRCRTKAAAQREAGESSEPKPGELSESEKRQVGELSQRDRHVRAHEQAHAAAGATNIRYEYQTGPDGRLYAIGGSAEIVIHAASSDPDSKIAQARRMRAAALAPADPSSQDAAIAARAVRIETEAQAEKTDAIREKQDELSEDIAELAPPRLFASA